MDKFVLGLAFTESADRVLLVTKLRPEWQKGFLNGIGGKIEKNELCFEAMHRECREETGLSLKWILKGFIHGIYHESLFQCYLFYAYSQDVLAYKQIEDEPLGLYNPLQIKPAEVIANLNFLIPYGVYPAESSFMSLTY